MNLLFFTPTNKSSAIGRMASLVVKELLSMEQSVTVIQTESPDLLNSTIHDFGTDVITWLELANHKNIIDEADQLIYQIGDNFQNHMGAVEFLQQHPGIVCLHDFFLGNLFWAWAETRKEIAKEILANFYNEDISNSYFNFSDSDSFIKETKITAPMTEWICSMAQGVITHSSWGCDRVLLSCPGPVQVLPLPYNKIISENKTKYQSIDNSKVQILTVGHVNSNKRIRSVITAIASRQELQDTYKYKIIGKITPEVKRSISKYAKDFGVDIEIMGKVNNEILNQAYAESDIISCLRWPVLEAASASAIEAMLNGKPIIVTDAGFYSELPDDYVFKVSTENEINEITEILLNFLIDKNSFITSGIKARKWASQIFSAQSYAFELTSFVNEVYKSKPIMEAIKFFSKTLNDWSGNVDLVTGKIFYELTNIFEF
jgi:glycosyltransferase involved in cell wall biosynthesis